MVGAQQQAQGGCVVCAGPKQWFCCAPIASLISATARCVRRERERLFTSMNLVHSPPSTPTHLRKIKTIRRDSDCRGSRAGRSLEKPVHLCPLALIHGAARTDCLFVCLFLLPRPIHSAARVRGASIKLCSERESSCFLVGNHLWRLSRCSSAHGRRSRKNAKEQRCKLGLQLRRLSRSSAPCVGVSLARCAFYPTEKYCPLGITIIVIAIVAVAVAITVTVMSFGLRKQPEDGSLAALVGLSVYYHTVGRISRRTNRRPRDQT